MTQQNLSIVFESALKVCLRKRNGGVKFRSRSENQRKQRPESILATRPSDKSSKCSIM